jgi:aspartate kinase
LRDLKLFNDDAIYSFLQNSDAIVSEIHTDRRHALGKFGGSSLASSNAWQHVFDHIRRSHHEQPMIVVVSAVGKTTRALVGCVHHAAQGRLDEVEQGLNEIWATHKLIAMECVQSGKQTALEVWVDQLLSQLHQEAIQIAKELLNHPSPLLSTHGDAILSFGERATSQIFQKVLEKEGVPSVWVDAREVIITDETFGAAKPDRAKIKDALTQHHALSSFWAMLGEQPSSREIPVPVLGGFMGRSLAGSSTTLGFEGSDLTATLLAEASNAERVTIYTDVDGIMTTDPRVVPNAKHIPTLSYDEAEDLALGGARVLHPQTLVPVVEQSIPVHVRNTFQPNHPGTIISPQRDSSAHTPFVKEWKAVAMAITNQADDSSVLTFLHATPDGQSQLRQWSEAYALQLDVDVHGWHLHLPPLPELKSGQNSDSSFPLSLQAIHDIFFP